MGTTADKLALLQRTKAGQRALLEEMYPDLDFSTVPFREYGRLFTGRKYVPGFVGGWKAYGRSNDEDAGTRKYLYDYSGNGRDIELFNFAFAGMSGYGGYPYNFNDFTFGTNTGVYNKISSSVLTVNAVNNGVTFFLSKTIIPSGLFKAKVKITGLEAAIAKNLVRRVRFYSNKATEIIDVTTDGIHDIEYTIPAEADSFWVYVESYDAEFHQLTTPITIAELPDYPGALVSDGVDDYGKCIKDFALPDDYTVVAIRKYIGNVNNSCLVAKRTGAFVFEYYGSAYQAYSYGNAASITPPALFSYQTKTSYNGAALTPGTSQDADTNVLTLFQSYQGGGCAQVALYDLRIYDHTLTAEELQTVKDEMMADYENATGGGITDITYVADWDGKGRSNDEEEPMRSQWIDKATGKVINLSNYSFSEMSGWGGYQFDWSVNWHTDYDELMTSVEIGKTKAVFSGFENIPVTTVAVLYNTTVNIPAGTTVRIKGTGFRPGEYFYCIDYDTLFSYRHDGNGILEFTTPNDIKYLRITVVLHDKIGRTITLEQLPLYPGALVSDGVDDSGTAQDNFSEPIGTVIVHYEDLGIENQQYVFNTDWETEGRLYMWVDSGNIFMGVPDTAQKNGDPFAILTREPSTPSGKLALAAQNKTAIYRLMLIKEQLDDTQLEFLTWKVGKEYRDWCKENGYEYAMEEMLNN